MGSQCVCLVCPPSSAGSLQCRKNVNNSLTLHTHAIAVLHRHQSSSSRYHFLFVGLKCPQTRTSSVNSAECGGPFGAKFWRVAVNHFIPRRESSSADRPCISRKCAR
ncbi:hypothetical protein OUZ56_007524 [Daphnia magna]|uniref:Secreted protein n=1 Tax=Daphnia magna TaxID=35525 RepID=A0ABR0AA79_9CRUS|nr:hypothetical protein OUZ56_007524 [Daphnia magna]